MEDSVISHFILLCLIYYGIFRAFAAAISAQEKRKNNSNKGWED